MPELPEVEAVARSLRDTLVGQKIAGVGRRGKWVKGARAKLWGYYSYYGVNGSYESLNEFFYRIAEASIPEKPGAPARRRQEKTPTEDGTYAGPVLSLPKESVWGESG